MPVISSCANKPTQIVPNTPLTRCTDKAPTGSSNLNLSNIITATTTSAPAIKPITKALPTLTNAQGAVIATRPARHPLRVIPRSGFPINNQQIIVELIIAAAAAVFVVTATCAIALGSAAIVEPGLNPNHPNHNMNVPIVASDRLCPGIALMWPLSYLPIRGPSITTPASAAHPPTL